MHSLFSLNQKMTERQLIYLLTLLGGLLAFVSNYIQHGWLNTDSLIYFESARLISIGEWKQALAAFNWPLYTTLLAFLHNLTGLSIQYCAQIWNIIFFTVTIFSFSKLIQIAGGDKLTITSGVFLLLSSSYISGSVLPMLLRDQGFWAAYLSSIVFFIKFYRAQRLTDALLWQVSAIIAVLFRIEAISFLALLPLLLLANHAFTFKQRLKLLLIINALPVFGLISLVTVLLASSSIHLSDFGRLQEVFNFLGDRGLLIAKNFDLKSMEMGKLLGPLLDDYSLFGFSVALVAISLLKVLKLISFPIIGIYIIASRHAKSITWTMHKDVQMILLALVTISSINALISITSTLCLSSRYIISIAFVAFIFGAFCLAQLIAALQKSNLNNRAYKLIIYLIIIILSASLVNNFRPKAAGYNHEKEAVDYIQEHHIPVETVFFTTPKTLFYAGLPYSYACNSEWKCIENAVSNGITAKYNYLLIYLDIDENIVNKEKFLSTNLSQYQLEKEFYGYKSKKKLMLYVKKQGIIE